MARKKKVFRDKVPAKWDDGQYDRRDTLRQAIKATNLSKSDFARLLEMDLRTLRRKSNGESPISGPENAIFHLLALSPDETMRELSADLMLGSDHPTVQRLWG